MSVRPRKTWAERKDCVKVNVKAAIEANDIDALIEALPPLQKQFAEEYIKDWNGAEAVRRTDSTTVYPEKVAYIWLQNPGIKMYLKHLSAVRTEQMRIDQGFVIQKLLKALEKAENTNNQQVSTRILELLAKHLGMLTDKQEITGKDGGAIQYEKLKQDADDFTRSIARLVKRDGTSEVSGDTDPGS